MMRMFIYILLSVFLLIGITALVLAQGSKYGRLPEGERLERIKKSVNYSNGAFQNINPTPVMADDVRFFPTLWEFLFVKNPRAYPDKPIPTIKTNLHQLDTNQNVLVWFGHSSYFMMIEGKTFLVDPVLSGHASPFSFSVKAFEGSNIYLPDDIPPIDYLLITHDHWDHLDYKTIVALKAKVKNIICPLGVGGHFESWGFNSQIIMEGDWNDTLQLDSQFRIDWVTARHFSGRKFKRNQTLWTAYVLQTPSLKIYIGGDGGYDSHFASAGQKYGSFDLAILENGQYDKKWPYIHTLPEQLVQVAADLNAHRVLPVHSGKFKLANHAWDEPLNKAAQYFNQTSIPLLTPMIGEKVLLDSVNQEFKQWWKPD